MKILVSTKETQGRRDNDFSFTTPNEWLYLGIPCREATGHVDDDCGCRRSLVGMDTHLSTTTMRVVDVDANEEHFLERLIEALDDAGWTELFGTAKARIRAETLCSTLLGAAARFDDGAVLEYRDGEFVVREKDL